MRSLTSPEGLLNIPAKCPIPIPLGELSIACRSGEFGPLHLSAPMIAERTR